MGSNTPSSVPGVFLRCRVMTSLERGPKEREIMANSRSVSSKEVVASLLGSKLANGGQHTKRITSQHNNITRLTIDHARNLGIWDEFDRVGTTRVLSDVDIVVIGRAVCRVVDDVLEDRTEPDGVVDLRLLFCREVDALCVTPSFDVEDAGVGGGVFVVPDE